MFYMVTQPYAIMLYIDSQERTQGGSGGSGEPPFQINYIHSMAWHACLEVQIVVKIPTKSTDKVCYNNSD